MNNTESEQENSMVEKNIKANILINDTRKLFLKYWHYFQYHAANYTPFMQSVAMACIELEAINPDSPSKMMGELAAIGERDRYVPHYDQILQKLAEILVMKHVVLMPWPQGTCFEIEGCAPGSDKQVDIVALLPDGRKHGFEVKAPQHSIHSKRRSENNWQIPSRGPNGLADRLKGFADDEATLPRDNTVRDFLRSANSKFSGFRSAGNFTESLVVVWDDFIYEVIGPLVNERTGLLTEKSYSKFDGIVEQFSNINDIFLLRHLTYFVNAAAENLLPDGRQHAMHIGGPGSLPNVIVPIPGNSVSSQFISDGFNAFPVDHPDITSLAEYKANELIIWTRF